MILQTSSIMYISDSITPALPIMPVTSGLYKRAGFPRSPSYLDFDLHISEVFKLQGWSILRLSE
jgi:hypothetical protein